VIFRSNIKLYVQALAILGATWPLSLLDLHVERPAHSTCLRSNNVSPSRPLGSTGVWGHSTCRRSDRPRRRARRPARQRGSPSSPPFPSAVRAASATAPRGPGSLGGSGVNHSKSGRPTKLRIPAENLFVEAPAPARGDVVSGASRSVTVLDMSTTANDGRSCDTLPISVLNHSTAAHAADLSV